MISESDKDLMFEMLAEMKHIIKLIERVLNED